MFYLDKKVAVVTGGDGFLGEYIIEELVAHNVGEIISLDVKDSETSIGLDITDMAAVRKFGSKLKAPIDILINNAAVSFKGKNTSDSQFRKMLEVNVQGTYNCIQGLEPFLSGDASIVNIASIYGVVSPDFKIYEGNEELYNSSAYGASKAAIIQMTKYYANLMAPVRVNAVSPGGIFQGHTDDFSQKYSDRVPLKRMANPQEIAQAVLFLSSSMSSYITGHNLVVDGGLSTC